MGKTKLTPFKVVDFLDSEEAIEEYLKAAYEDGIPYLIELAEKNAVEARAKLAADRIIAKMKEAREAE